MLFLKGNFSEKHQQSRMDYKKQRKHRIMHANLKVTGEMCDYHLYPGSRKSYNVRSPGFALKNY
jgi:hypothetical protein